MFRISGNNQRHIKKNIFAFGVGDAMKLPIFVGISFVPLETFTILNNILHLQMYVITIYTICKFLRFFNEQTIKLLVSFPGFFVNRVSFFIEHKLATFRRLDFFYALYYTNKRERVQNCAAR